LLAAQFPRDTGAKGEGLSESTDPMVYFSELEESVEFHNLMNSRPNITTNRIKPLILIVVGSEI